MSPDFLLNADTMSDMKTFTVRQAWLIGEVVKGQGAARVE